MEKKRIVLGITGASGVVYGIRLLDILIRLGHEVHVVISPISEQILAFEQRMERMPVPEDKYDGISAEETVLVDTQFFLMNAIASIHRMFKFRTLSREMNAVEDEDDFAWIGVAIDVGRMSLYRYDDFFASISSGSFTTDAMVIAPCSTSTLASIASGINQHLVHRAAEVHLKQKRPLVLMLRETPLSLIHIENMATITRAGGTILPASPYFYGAACGDPTGIDPLGKNPIASGTVTVADLIDSIVGRILDQIGLEHPILHRWEGIPTEAKE